MNSKSESLKRFFSGFQTLSPKDKSAYLEYFGLVIERQSDLSEKNRLIKFKNRLEKVKNNTSKSVKTLEKQGV